LYRGTAAFLGYCDLSYKTR